MATIIDFSPAATEIASLAADGKWAKAHQPLELATPFSGNIFTNRDFGRQFYQNAPDMLFCAEYAPNDKLLGILVAWENYRGATHYEVFKRDKLSAASEWKRILMLSAYDLKYESAQYAPFINDTLGIPLKIPDNGYCIMDSDFTIDRIYEYKVVATMYPKQAGLDDTGNAFYYDLIMESHGLLKQAEVANFDRLFEFATRVYGTVDYAWAISLVNKEIPFFGLDATKKTFSQLLAGSGKTTVSLPIDLNDIMKLFVESLHHYGIRISTFNLLHQLRDPKENTHFFADVYQSFNMTQNSFSFGTLNTKLAAHYPKYATVISNAQNGIAPPPGITLFNYNDITDFANFANMTLFVNQINSILINVLYAQATT